VQQALAGLKKPMARKAVMTWANWIGLESQGEMRKTIGQRFTFRGTADGFKKAIVFQSATQRGEREVKAELKVGGPGFGQSRTQNLGVILARHEEAGTRTRQADTGLASLVRISGNRLIPGGFFLPANNLRTGTANPPRSLYPRAIGVQMRADADGRMFFASSTKKGSKKRGTGSSFFATEKGIFQRRHTAFGRADVRAIWWFKRSVRTPARLGLWDTAERVFQVRAVALGLQAIEETLFRAQLADLQRGAPKRLL
jgi:hypothetical protein